jgi:TPR repeat protein
MHNNTIADLNTVARCAECGEGGAGLKTCKSCKDVKYCSVTCQRLNWPRHKKECKQRAAKLHDESLFKQPPPKDDCPICFLPMPFAYADMASFFPCCGKVVCNGCDYTRDISGSRKCPFCNTSLESEHEIRIKQMMKRVEANDVNSMTFLGGYYASGSLGLRQDRSKAFELWTRAAELGSSEAHYQIGTSYYQGLIIEKDVKKAIHHYELAAMAGHEMARYDLGVIEYNSGNMERAIKHWTISASAGWSGSMTAIQEEFKRGHLQSDLFELTLKAYNDSCVEMRSKAREDAAYFTENGVARG